VFEHWSAEFDQLYAERKAFVLAMHPQIIGRPSRITLLERLIQHIQQHEDARFYRCDQLALELKDAL
jgi:peptidoglycan/xylan/chitin deacetylase (PgdA/CDA1 family)